MKDYQFNLTSIICLHTVKWLNSSVWPTDTTSPSQCRPGSNDYEEVIYISLSSRTRASPSDAVSYSGQLLWGGVFTFAKICIILPLLTGLKMEENQHIYIYICVCVCVCVLATVVEGDKKAPFAIATTPRCKRGRHFFPWISPLYPWYVPYIAEC